MTTRITGGDEGLGPSRDAVAETAEHVSGPERAAVVASSNGEVAYCVEADGRHTGEAGMAGGESSNDEARVSGDAVIKARGIIIKR